jgi:hypothetical protein
MMGPLPFSIGPAQDGDAEGATEPETQLFIESDRAPVGAVNVEERGIATGADMPRDVGGDGLRVALAAMGRDRCTRP